MPVYGGVTFDEEDGSPKFMVSEWKVEAIQTGFTAWTDVFPFYNYLLSPTLLYGTLIGVFAGAGMPGSSNLHMYQANAEPWGGIIGADANGLNIYAQAKWTIKYHNLTANPNSNTKDPVPMLTHEWDIGGEFIILKGINLQWVSDSTTILGDARGGILIPSTEMTVSWPRLTTPPFAAIRSLRGKVNQNSLTFDTGTSTPETLLFLGAKVRRDTLNDGTLAFTFSYKFSERIVPASDSATFGSVNGGWNHYWREDKGGFYKAQRVTAGPDGTKNIYQLGDFTALFAAGS